MSDRLLKWLLGFLGLAFVAVVGVGAYIYNNDAGFFTINAEPTPTATSTPTPTQSTVAVMRVPVPADSSCKDCHTQGAISVPDVPPMGHQLDGWNNCTQCHGQAKLVKTAPGHRGIHRDSCLLCHTQQGPSTVSVPPRLHRAYPDKSCTSCHKVGGSGPLPANMVGRKNCWVCHISAKNQDLFDTTTAS